MVPCMLIFSISFNFYRRWLNIVGFNFVAKYGAKRYVIIVLLRLCAVHVNLSCCLHLCLHIYRYNIIKMKGAVTVLASVCPLIWQCYSASVGNYHGLQHRQNADNTTGYVFPLSLCAMIIVVIKNRNKEIKF